MTDLSALSREALAVDCKLAALTLLDIGHGVRGEQGKVIIQQAAQVQEAARRLKATCQTCRHLRHREGYRDYCRKVDTDVMDIHPDFGCTLHESREEPRHG